MRAFNAFPFTFRWSELIFVSQLWESPFKRISTFPLSLICWSELEDGGGKKRKRERLS